MEIIKNIEKAIWKDNIDDWKEFEGYIITTNEQVIKIGITNSQECCEQWGYMTSEDDLNEYIGAELYEIKPTDIGRRSVIIQMKSKYIDLSSIMFIDLVTSYGDLQFAVYNEHNGYYGHNIIISSKQLNIDKYI